MRNIIVFCFLIFISQTALPDVKGVFEAKSRGQEINVYYRDDNHFKVEFVKSASKRVLYSFTKRREKAYVVSTKNGTTMAIDLSTQLREKEGVACSIRITLQRNNEKIVVQGISGELFTSIINKDPSNSPMILSKDSLAQKITEGYFLALGALSNDGKHKPNNFVDPLALYSCIRDTGFPAVISENPNVMLKSVAEIEVTDGFYGLPKNAHLMPKPRK